MYISGDQKEKYLSTLIVTVGALLGFEAISYAIGIYQLRQSLFLSFYIYAFHIFWLTFLFDLHLKKRGVLANARLNHKGAKMLWEACKERLEHVRRWEYLRHYQNYLVLPGLLYWSTIILLFLNPFNGALKQLIVLTASFAMSFRIVASVEGNSPRYRTSPPRPPSAIAIALRDFDVSIPRVSRLILWRWTYSLADIAASMRGRGPANPPTAGPCSELGRRP